MNSATLPADGPGARRCSRGGAPASSPAPGGPLGEGMPGAADGRAAGAARPVERLVQAKGRTEPLDVAVPTPPAGWT